MKAYLGVDLGTSSVKVGAFSAEGRELCMTSREYPMFVDAAGMSELDPEQVYRSMLEAMEECLAALDIEVAAIGFSTQLYSLLAVDRLGQPLGRALTWADSRSGVLSHGILNSADIPGIYARTAGRIEHPVTWFAKLTWLSGQRPEWFAPDVRFISIKGYMLYRLTGLWAMDWSDASSTGLMDIHRFDWDDEAVGQVPGLRREQLPPLRDCVAEAGGLLSGRRERLGLRAPLFMGAGDGMCAHLGCGALADGQYSSTVGTSGALRAGSERPVLDPERRTFCFCLARDFYVSGGAINNGGLVLNWLRDLFPDQWAADVARGGHLNFFALLEEAADEIVPGCEGLFLMPFLTGERAPNWNGEARAVFSGLTLSHDRRHLLRAALEGVMFQMRGVYEALSAVCGPASQILANGGYTSSKLWLQIQADVFGLPVCVSGVPQASALGAAYLAMAGAGAIPSLRTPLPVMTPGAANAPDEARARAYQGIYGEYRGLYARHFGG